MTLNAPTEAEARTYGEQFVDAVSKSNTSRASVMIDWDTLLDRATAGTDGEERSRKAFIRGAKQSAETTYMQQLAMLVSQGGELALLRIRGDEHERRALLRMITPNNGVTYNDMLLTKDAAGVVRAVDIYSYASGEYVSAPVRRLYMQAVASEPTLMGKLAGKKNEMVSKALMFQELTQKTLSGQYQEVVDLFKRMSPDMQHEKNVLVAYVSASAHLGEEQYTAAMDELRKAFPNDPGIDLMLVDGFILRKHYDEAIQAIDRIDKSLGGDPFLDVLRSNIYMAKGDDHAARSSARRAAEREPSLARWMR